MIRLASVKSFKSVKSSSVKNLSMLSKSNSLQLNELFRSINSKNNNDIYSVKEKRRGSKSEIPVDLHYEIPTATLDKELIYISGHKPSQSDHTESKMYMGRLINAIITELKANKEKSLKRTGTKFKLFNKLLKCKTFI